MRHLTVTITLDDAVAGAGDIPHELGQTLQYIAHRLPKPLPSDQTMQLRNCQTGEITGSVRITTGTEYDDRDD